MKYYKFVFSILTYRNTNDVCECIKSIKQYVSDAKIVIVNSYYDDSTCAAFEKIAQENDCDFLNVPNKGYGYGNNRGIEYILRMYHFSYLIICNPDVVIKKFDDNFRFEGAYVIAPLIVTQSGKNQNPYWLVKNQIAEFLIYSGTKNKRRIEVFAGIAINKAIREAGLFFFKRGFRKYRKVYAAHGSFMILSSDVLKKMPLLFDEGMFLFAEEALLAHRFEQYGINIYLTKNVHIFHKEDGSISVSNINENAIQNESITYYYEMLRKESSNKAKGKK